MTKQPDEQSRQAGGFKTQQEQFWAGEFGTDYIERNRGAFSIASNLAFFSRALKQTSGIDSCIEFGANIGLNLRALRQLLPSAALSAIEINGDAARALSEWLSSSGGGGDYPGVNSGLAANRHL